MLWQTKCKFNLKILCRFGSKYPFMKNKVFIIALIAASSLLSLSFHADAPGLDWKFYFGKNYLLVPPVLNNGIVYVGGEEGIMYALDSKRGKVIWEFKAEGAIAQPPIIENDFLYYCTKAGKVYCQNAENGKLIWTVHINSKLVCTPQIAQNMLCIYSRNEIMGLDKVNGLDMWKTSMKISDNPKMATDETNIFLADDMKVYSLNSLNGNLNWEYDLSIYGVSDVLFADDKVLFVNNSKVFALDKDSGKKKWIYELESRDKVGYQNKAAFLDGKVIVSFASELLALDSDTAEEIWTYKTKTEEELYEPIIYNNSIWISSRGNRIFNISPEKGKKIESYEIELKQESPVRYENNMLFFTRADGHAIGYRLL